jgi:hypothetical protein
VAGATSKAKIINVICLCDLYMPSRYLGTGELYYIPLSKISDYDFLKNMWN